MRCNVCKGTGFCNYEQVPEEIAEEGDLDKVIAWMKSIEGHDVSVCVTAAGTGRPGTEIQDATTVLKTQEENKARMRITGVCVSAID